jgi:beta-galactosidase
MVTAEVEPLLEKGHVVAVEQFLLPWHVEMPPARASTLLHLYINEDDATLSIHCEDTRIEFSKKTGMLISYQYKGQELIEKGPEPNFWRPPNDNDFGNKMPQLSAVWRTAGDKRILKSFQLQNIDNHAVIATALYDLPEIRSRVQMLYKIISSGDIIIQCDFITREPSLPELPRFGIKMVLPPGFERIRFYGRGPQENYCDRYTAALVGLYESTVSDQYYPYISPQENGNRTGVRWMALSGPGNTGLMAVGMPFLSMSALHYSIDDFNQESRGSKHTIDLVKKDQTFLCVDLKQRGIGGDDSWRSKPHAQYCLPAKNYTFQFRLSPFSEGDDLMGIGKIVFIAEE